jgi:hypothetical protein
MLSWIVLGVVCLAAGLFLLHLWAKDAEITLREMQEWEEVYFRSALRALDDDKKAEEEGR